MRLMFTRVLGRYAASTVIIISTQTFRKVLDRVGGQLRGDKGGPFSGVTKSGRVWRKVPESDARSVTLREHRFPAPSVKLYPI